MDEVREITYVDHLEPLAKEDVMGLKTAEHSYRDSWKQRGGVGAFMMLARKWDRLENLLKPHPVNEELFYEAIASINKLMLKPMELDKPSMLTNADYARGRLADIEHAYEAARAEWDIFKAIDQDARPEGVIDDIRDLRRYLLLVEAEMRARAQRAAASV